MYFYKKNNKPVYALKNDISNYPEIDSTDFIEITEDEWNELTKIPEPTEEEKLKQQYLQEMSEIKKWLNDNDYIINKHLLGEYTDADEKWINYLSERKIKLARYNELENLIK